ncbi:MAG: DUF7305 domain-containing protein [Coraliomargarita sp.]
MNHKKTPISDSRRQGSALISAVIFSTIAAVLAVSYLTLANAEYKSSMRSYLYSSSLNLAEAGVEYSINELINGSAATYSTWVDSATNLFTDGPFSGDVKVVVLNASSSSPTIYAEGKMTGHTGGDVVKQVRVELSSGFQPFEKGFAARNGMTLSGNGVLMDSYHSNYGAYNAPLGVNSGAPAGWGVNGYNKNDEITVASDSITTADSSLISQGNADIYGYVAVSPGSNVSIGPNGSVQSYGGSHDASRIEYDFYADFPVQVAPTSGVTNISNITRAMTLNAGTYKVDSVSMSGNSRNILNISGDVTLIVTGDVSFTGQSSINVPNGSTLTMYADGDVAIGGNGIVNGSGVPADVFVYGTQDAVDNGDGTYSAGQSIKIAGNGYLAAAVYAPGADLTLNGGGSRGDVLGSAVGFTATITGGSSFHFDEALQDIVFGGGNYSIDSWLEMTGATVASTPIDMSNYSDTN